MNWSRGLYRVWYLVLIIIGLVTLVALIQRPSQAVETLQLGASMGAFVFFAGLAIRWVVRGFRKT